MLRMPQRDHRHAEQAGQQQEADVVQDPEAGQARPQADQDHRRCHRNPSPGRHDRMPPPDQHCCAHEHQHGHILVLPQRQRQVGQLQHRDVAQPHRHPPSPGEGPAAAGDQHHQDAHQRCRQEWSRADASAHRVERLSDIRPVHRPPTQPVRFLLGSRAV